MSRKSFIPPALDRTQLGRTLFVSGGAGFIGAHFIDYWLARYPTDTIINYDRRCGAEFGVDRAASCSRCAVIKGDIRDRSLISKVFEAMKPTIVVNFAAESHDALSLVKPAEFFSTNLLGTQTLLDAAKSVGVHRFHHISTYGVYGDGPLSDRRKYNENSPLEPRTPYYASKAAADLACLAYWRTWDVPFTISRSCNTYGPGQLVEKAIPRFTTQALREGHILVEGTGATTREWLHVRDHCRAIEDILEKGTTGEVYNVGSGVEIDIGTVAREILACLDLPAESVKFRPSSATPRRCCLDSTKIADAFGWEPSISFGDGIRDTVKSYKDSSSSSTAAAVVSRLSAMPPCAARPHTQGRLVLG
jgi:dTDP-glucose 4,6-dehydratase